MVLNAHVCKGVCCIELLTRGSERESEGERNDSKEEI